MKSCSLKSRTSSLNWVLASLSIVLSSLASYSWCFAITTNATARPTPSATTRNISDPVNQYFFLNEIFKKYGANGTMNFEGFEHLLFNLGLGGLVIDDHNLSDHKSSPFSREFSENHGSHEHGVKVHKSEDDHRKKRWAQSPSEQEGTSIENDNHYFSDIDHENLFVAENPEKEDNECLSPNNLLKVFNLNMNKNITVSNFLHLCPAIVYELDEKHCTKDPSFTPHIHAHDEVEEVSHEGGEHPSSDNVWTYACISILVISLCGFLSVGAVPLMQRVFYHQLLKFLVALAIGTLTGDAFLHLIPHALAPHGHKSVPETSEENSVWKGLTALFGIYFFFVTERIINIVTMVCQKRKTKDESNEMDIIPVKDKKNTIGEKLSGHQKHDSYGYANPDPNSSLQLLDVKSSDPSAGQSSARRKELEANGNHRNNFENFSETQFDSSGVVTIVEKVPLNGHGHSHSHGHGHGHSHEVPASISAVAYMVIMGDGLHNFTDGLAIGAAFAANITGGLSTSIAVFCHELPHELGDFAVLLKSGMTTRQALFYNFLSSVLCFVGMLIGVGLGNMASISNWIFAAAAGMFIYISLVDMMPQLQNSDSEIPKPTDLLLHLVGIFSGVSLMLLIALYEQDLKNAVG